MTGRMKEFLSRRYKAVEQDRELKVLVRHSRCEYQKGAAKKTAARIASAEEAKQSETSLLKIRAQERLAQFLEDCAQRKARKKKRVAKNKEQHKEKRRDVELRVKKRTHLRHGRLDYVEYPPLRAPVPKRPFGPVVSVSLLASECSALKEERRYIEVEVLQKYRTLIGIEERGGRVWFTFSDGVMKLAPERIIAVRYVKEVKRL